MLGLPKSTEVRRALPKAQLFKQFDWKPAWRTAFDEDVARLDFVHWISPKTVPAIATGTDIKEIYIVEVELKSIDYNFDNIQRLAKAIPQKIVWALTCGGKVCIAVYQSRLFSTAWQAADAATLPLNGLDFDAVWQNIVSAIGNFTVSPNSTLTEQIQTNEERAKIERQIATLKRQMAASNQPRRKHELYCQIQELKGGIK